VSLILGNQAVTDAVIARLDALTPKLYKQIVPLLLGAGVVEATLHTPQGNAASEVQEYITLVENSGVVGDMHNCPTAAVDGREDVLRFVMGLPKGVPMARLRQVTLVSREEGGEVAERMGLGVATMQVGLQMENLVVSAFPNLSALAPRTLVTFFSAEGEARTATLHIIALNAPCGHPDRVIREHYGIRTPAQPYTTAAEGRRGLVAVVKTGGMEPGVGGRVYPGDIAVFWEHD
jgi:hypothetical protein